MDYLYEGKWEELILEPSGDTFPIGAQVAFGGTTIPTNWLECNGQAVSRETYKDLFSVIGTYYGEGDGSTTFNLPDKRSRKSVGRDTSDTDFDTVGKTGGEKEHVLTINEMPEHHHAGIKYSNYNQWLTSETGSNGNTIGLPFNTGGNPLNSVKSNENLQYSTDQRGGSQAHNNEDPYEVDCWIIKCANSIGLVGEVTSDINDTNSASAPNAKTVKDYVDNKVVDVYSTDEIKTNKVWIDGKPIYRKVINMGDLPSNSSKIINHNIKNIDFVTSISGLGVTSTNHYNIPFSPNEAMFSGLSVSMRASSTEISVSVNKTVSGHTVYGIMEYTKTTD